MDFPPLGEWLLNAGPPRAWGLNRDTTRGRPQGMALAVHVVFQWQHGMQHSRQSTLAIILHA